MSHLHAVPSSDHTPQNLEAEQAILGSLLIDPGAIKRVAYRLKSSDFWLPTNGAVYETITALDAEETKPDLVTVSDRLQARGQLDEVGGITYLAGLAQATPTSLNVEHYARIVERLSIHRQIIDAGRDIERIGAADGEIEESLASAERRLLEVRRSQFTQAQESMPAFWLRLRDEILGARTTERGGIKSGIGSLDSIVGMFRPGSMTVIGAPAGTGKTSLVTTIARHVAVDQRKPVLFYSVEMTRDQIGLKVLSIQAGVPFALIEDARPAASDHPHIAEASRILAEAPLKIVDAGGYTMERVRAETEIETERLGKVGLVVVDYLQSLDFAGYDNLNLGLTDAVRLAKQRIAQSLQCHVMLLCSLNNKYVERAGREPILSDLRDSGNIGFAADTALLMWPPSEEERTTTPARPPINCKVDKNRLGKTGHVAMALLADRMEVVAPATHYPAAREDHYGDF